MLSSRGFASRNDARPRVESSVRGSLTDWAPSKLSNSGLIPCRQFGDSGQIKGTNQQRMTCVNRLVESKAPAFSATPSLLECARRFQRSTGMPCATHPRTLAVVCTSLSVWNDSSEGERTLFAYRAPPLVCEFVRWPFSRTMRRNSQDRHS